MIRLHHCHQTRSMRALWLLHEPGVTFEAAVHGFDKSLPPHGAKLPYTRPYDEPWGQGASGGDI